MTIHDTFIAKRIAELRTHKDVSARDMSLSLGQSESYINKIENGKTMPSMMGFLYICDYFQISPSDFFSEDISNPMLLKDLSRELKGLSPRQMNAVLEMIRSFK